MALIMVVICVLVVLGPQHGFTGHAERHPGAEASSLQQTPPADSDALGGGRS
jgi:hypothetical protein